MNDIISSRTNNTLSLDVEIISSIPDQTTRNSASATILSILAEVARSCYAKHFRLFPLITEEEGSLQESQDVYMYNESIIGNIEALCNTKYPTTRCIYTV